MRMKIKKRIFISLLVACIIMLLCITVAGVMLYLNKFSHLYRPILLVVIAVMAVLIAILSIGLAAIVLTLWHEKSFLGPQKLMNFCINLLFPIALTLGRLLNIHKDIIKSSYIEVNNRLVKSRNFRIKPDEILVLAPHCLQRWDCPYKITANVSNCRRCGRCDIDKLLSLVESRGVKLAVATGGTLARKIVMEYKPRAIVAIACERDLSEGILDTNPIPVLGILNIRPQGPCMNTRVDIEMVREAVDFFLDYGLTASFIWKGSKADEKCKT
ncbi:protein of unknown function DUF116 [Thermosediminibacter oceani DSM 16646]|uniref:DUF116 domain-containing protein n=2 Tax=Thermosediminibacter TaxID=291988 RepID=D9S313_THEOJ|nr:protein of unknown function DUF116 [Thermosediminibacter oceani DSM 16646]